MTGLEMRDLVGPNCVGAPSGAFAASCVGRRVLVSSTGANVDTEMGSFVGAFVGLFDGKIISNLLGPARGNDNPDGT